MVFPPVLLNPGDGPGNMCTSGEKVRISVEAESVQSISYSHIRSLSGLYTVVGF